MHDRKRTLKSQSAMEYLMTYGWAILLIAVVLATLFSVGLFNQGSFSGNSCVPTPGFLCTGATISGDGNVIFTLGQYSGSTFYNVELACVATTSSNGYPYATQGGDPSPWYILGPSGSAISGTISGGGEPYGGWTELTSAIAGSLPVGQQVTVPAPGLPCFTQQGTYFSNVASPVPVGTSYTGTLWINYTLTSAHPSSSTGHILQIGTITLKTES